MKTLRYTKLVALALSLILAFSAQALAAENYQVDPAHAMVFFRIKHLGVSYSYGRFNDIAGQFTVDKEDVAKSSLELEIQAESVDTANERRDQHLKSPDFLNAKQFPVITFKSTEIKKGDDGIYLVTGELMLHGVKKSITIGVKQTGEGDIPQAGYRIGFESEFTIKRSDFGMNFMPEAVGDEVQLMVTIEGIRG